MPTHKNTVKKEAHASGVDVGSYTYGDTRPVDPTQRLHDRLEYFARETPEAIALEFGTESLTYREVNTLSNNVAHELQAEGVTPNEIVAVVAHRSLLLPIALFGILKAGGAYLPIDPDQSMDRIKFLLTDSNAKLILKDSGIHPDLDARTNTLDIEKSSRKPVDAPVKDLAKPSDLAYVIYTSGSTGNPKGVMIEHRSIVTRLLWMADQYDFSGSDAQIQKTPITFDVSVHELFLWSFVGARLVIPMPGAEKDPETLINTIEKHGVTQIHFVPSMLDTFLEYVEAFSKESVLSKLRNVYCSGEALPKAAVIKFIELIGEPFQVGLHNLYGPTEAAVDVSFYDCRDFKDGNSIPIGKPVWNTQLHILDRNLRHLSAGETGELFIGGLQVGRGYLNSPSLTKTFFLDDPFSEQPESRLYRTGDLARLLPDGNIEYLGRNDFQIKVRGVRIEPAEIESELRKVSGINGAAVIARKLPNTDTQLIGYITRSAGINERFDEKPLLLKLKQHLPPQMIPSTIVELESLPLTSSGKLDRKALPLPSNEKTPDTQPADGSRTHSTKERLRTIFAQLLNANNLQDDSDFISLGGHSLLAIRLLTQIKRQFKVALSISDIFSLRTIKSIAETIDRHGDESAAPTDLSIPKLKRNESACLSSVQEHILLESLRNPDKPIYNEVCTIAFDTSIEPKRLERAFNKVILRHEIFRTSFNWEDGELSQFVHESAKLEIPVEEFFQGEPLDRVHRAEAFANEWSTHLFDLKQPPLIKAFLAVFNDHKSSLYLVTHHLAADAFTSFDILVKDLWAYYQVTDSDTEADLPHLEIQYADFAVWQRNQQMGIRYEKNLAFWSEKLRGSKALELQLDHPRPKILTYNGSRTFVRLSRTQSAKVKALAERLKTTQFVILLSAFYGLLHRITQQTDIAIGSVAGGRDNEITNGVAGCFLNYLTLRTEVQGKLTFSDLTNQVEKTLYEALEHQGTPLLDLLESLGVERDQSRHPLYQVMFLMEPPIENLPEGWSVSQQDFHPRTSKLDLTFEMDERNGQIFGRVEYNTDLFEPDTIDRLINQYETFLESVAAEPNGSIIDSEILNDEGKSEVLNRFNATHHPIDETLRLHDFLEEFAHKTPDAIALEFGGESMSYKMLKKYSDNVAVSLQSHGAKPDQVIAVIARRSLWLPVALFGVLKSGSAYLPIDPDQPSERIKYLLEDSGTKIALVDSKSGVPLETIEESLEIVDIAQRNSEVSPKDTAKPENLAYVIYTSGSTGKPKGAMIEHKSICNRLEWMAAYYHFSESATQLLKTPITFDVSVHELFLWSFVGARLSIAPPGAEKDPAELVELIKNHEVTHIHFVPSMLDGFLGYLTAFEVEGSLASLQNVFCSGEVLLPTLVSTFNTLIGNPYKVGLHNLYGPTEAAVDVTYFDCSQLGNQPSVPIGKPVWNTQIYILDKHLNPLPVGISGDLYIGGRQVGRGYINRKELTEMFFIEDPFSSATNARLYKTGDEARWLPDGNIEYLGRSDFQVKIRGIRIELGEIETSIRGFPGVTGAIVIATKVENDTTLIGYYTYNSQVGSKAKTDLACFLRKKLPEQLIPHHLVELPEFPLTISGKLDRKALPEPTLATPFSEENTVLPNLASPTEELAYSIWCEILGIPSAQGSSGFFELGGHSLLAIKLLGRLRSSLGISLALPDFLKEPSFDGLLDAISNSTTHNASITKRNITSPIPLSWGQRRMWYLHEIDDSKTGFVIAYGLLIKGFVDINRLETSITKLIKTHEGLRTVFKNLENQLVQELLPDPIDPSSYISKENVSGEATEVLCKRILNEEWSRKFELEKGPLFHARITIFSNDKSFVTFAFHHIIADEAIEEIVYRAIEAYYRDDTSATFEPQLQIGDYSLWERSELFATRLPAHVSWWKDYLEGAPTELTLPYDFPKTAAVSFRGKRVTASLNHSSSEKFRKLFRNSDATQFMGFQVAWSLFLGELCQVDDLLIGAPVSLRSQPDLEHTIGFLINSLPFRTCYSKQDSFSGLIKKNRKQIIEAYTHAELPFDQLVDKLNVNRSQSASPVFQVMLVMNGQPSPGPRFGQADTIVLSTDPDTAKFDLTLFVNDRSTGFELKLEYRNDIFLEETIEGWLECFTHFLEELSEQPDVSISRIQLVSDPTRARQLSWAQGTSLSQQSPSTLPNLIEEASEKFSSRTAIQHKSKSLSYEELQQYARSLSTKIERSHIQNRKIGVCFDKTPELFVCLQAIMRDRAAYVPLDVDWPKSRLAWVIEDSDIDLILVQHGRHSATIREIVKDIVVQEFDLDSLSDTSEESHTPDYRTTPADLAYMIYTSGSTGHPKGVLVNQRNVVSSTLARSAFYGSYPERFLLLSPPIFDSSVAGIFWTLTQGGTLVLPDFGVEKDPQQLSQLLVQESITHILCLPSVLDGLLDFLDGKENALATVIVAGETCPTYLPKKFRNILPNAKLYNEYGPTEGTVWCSVGEITHADDKPRVSIGKPISNSRLYITGKDQKLLPTGALGEIIIAGEGVTDGYHKLPDLTKERFLKPESSDIDEPRIYRTGDLGKWCHDGSLEFHGRIDEQVKIRGYRIEPGEIESSIRDLESVREAAVIVKSYGPNDQRLVAFVATDSGNAAKDIQKSLINSLPSYMVPSHIEIVTSIPYTASGKMDRKTLSQYSLTNPSKANSSSKELINDPITEKLIGIWKTVISTEDVGPDDDFFQIGGHSFLAVRLFAQIRKTFDVQLPVASLINAPTVRLQTKEIRSRKESKISASNFVPIKEGSIKAPLFCIHARDGGVLMYRDIAGHISDISIMGVESSWQAKGVSKEPSVEEMAAEYLPGILELTPEGQPVNLCGFSSGGLIAFELARMLEDLGRKTGTVSMIDTFNPGNPPRRMSVRERWTRRLRFEENQSIAKKGVMVLQLLFRTVVSVLNGLREPSAAALAKLWRMTGTDVPVHLKTYEAREATVDASLRYRPKSFEVPITLFRGLDTDDGYERSDDLGWKSVCGDHLSIIEVPWDHGSIIHDESAARIAAHLEEAVKKTSVPDSGL